MLGSLLAYVHAPSKNFQPMNANFGIVPAPERRRHSRKERNEETSRAALAAMQAYREQNAWLFE
jgi:methylenetetrahydrofolate--tRNA-(uracil-5-)-methyltransferase